MILGCDECGLGPLSHDLWAVMVVFHSDLPKGLRDSKKLSQRKREALAIEINERAHVSVGIATVAEIDRFNVLNANMIAMQRAFDGLPKGLNITKVMIDGIHAPKLDTNAIIETIIGGDDLIPEISAASIIAKVGRDKMVLDTHEEYPWYGWKTNKGYGTAEHLKAISDHGPSPYHRMSFGPLKQPSLF